MKYGNDLFTCSQSLTVDMPMFPHTNSYHVNVDLSLAFVLTFESGDYCRLLTQFCLYSLKWPILIRFIFHWFKLWIECLVSYFEKKVSPAFMKLKWIKLYSAFFYSCFIYIMCQDLFFQKLLKCITILIQQLHPNVSMTHCQWIKHAKWVSSISTYVTESKKKS